MDDFQNKGSNICRDSRCKPPDKPWNDEFDVVFPDALELGRYEYVKDHSL